jgi:hypothetical protein
MGDGAMGVPARTGTMTNQEGASLHSSDSSGNRPVKVLSQGRLFVTLQLA